jgi:PadR family transcriptional regulator, regulatory protein PadR
MGRPRNTSSQIRAVLAALIERPQQWRYGLELARETDLKSGTLYPLLIRLADDGYLESRWMEPEKPGRPPRHAYRLNAKGVAFAHASFASTTPSTRLKKA